MFHQTLLIPERVRKKNLLVQQPKFRPAKSSNSKSPPIHLHWLQTHQPEVLGADNRPVIVDWILATLVFLRLKCKLQHFAHKRRLARTGHRLPSGWRLKTLSQWWESANPLLLISAMPMLWKTILSQGQDPLLSALVTEATRKGGLSNQDIKLTKRTWDIWAIPTVAASHLVVHPLPHKTNPSPSLRILSLSNK